MAVKPKRVPVDKSFAVQIVDMTDFTEGWKEMDAYEKREYDDSQLEDYFCIEVEVDGLESWFSKKNAANLTHAWMAGCWWELAEVVHKAPPDGPMVEGGFLEKMVEAGLLVARALPEADEQGKALQFQRLTKPQLGPYCDKHGVSKSQRKDHIIEELIAAHAVPPVEYEFTRTDALSQVVEENLARFVKAAGENMSRFPMAYRDEILLQLKWFLSDVVTEPEQFIATHIGIDLSADNDAPAGRDAGDVIEIDLDDVIFTSDPPKRSYFERRPGAKLFFIAIALVGLVIAVVNWVQS